MKISIKSTVALALAIATVSSTPSIVSGADITVVGADAGDMKDMKDMKDMDMKTMDNSMDKRMRMRGSTSDRSVAAGADVKIAAMDVLNKPTALLNKNTLAMGNNVFVSRSNILFSQSDRLALAKKVEDVLSSGPATTSTSTEAAEADADTKGAEASKDVATAVLTKNVLRAVSGKDTDTDAALMSKASAVVAAKGDAVLRGQRVADLVDAVFDRKPVTNADASLSIEQTLQTDVPPGVVVLGGTKDILREPTVAGKTMDSKEDAVGDNYRVGFLYRKENKGEDTTTAETKAETEHEQFGVGGCGFGWRYPLGYWNLYGAGLYGGGCGLGLAYGPYFYC